MKFRLTPLIQHHVKDALDHPDLSIVYREEAEKIKMVDLEETSLHPVSMDLVHHLADITGYKKESKKQYVYSKSNTIPYRHLLS